MFFEFDLSLSLCQFQRMRADEGDPEAMLWLGRMHFWGRGGLPRDNAAAVRLA